MVTAELRSDVRALEPASLVRRHLAQRLDEAVRRTEELAAQLARLRAEESGAMDRVREAIADLIVESM